MYIQLLVLFLAFLGLVYYHQQKLNGKCDSLVLKRYIAFCCVILILQSGLRNVAVGPDTYAYQLDFEATQVKSWQEVFENFYQVYVLGEGKDAGYDLFVKLFQVFSNNYRVYLFSVAIIFFISFGRFVYRNATNLRGVFIAMCVYQVLFYSFFSITGIRQTLATAIIFFAYEFIVKRRLFSFLLLCFAAALIHKSALLFVPFYFLATIKYPVRTLVLVLLSLPMVFIMIRQIAYFLTSFSFSESYAVYANSTNDSGGAQMVLLFMLFVAAGIIIFRKRYRQVEVWQLPIMNAFTIALFFIPLTLVDPGLMRVAMYYSIFTMFLLGSLVDNFDSSYNHQSDLVAIVSVLLLCAVLVKRDADYAFLWEYMELGDNYDIYK